MASLAYTELPGSPVESIGETGEVTVRMSVMCQYSERYDVAKLFYGEIYNRMTWPLCVCRTVSVQPYSGGRGMPLSKAHQELNTYEYAQLDATFSSKGVDPKEESELWLQEEITPTTQMLSVSPTGMTWGGVSGPKVEQSEAPAKLVFGMSYTRTYMQVRKVPWQALAWIGYSNDSPLEIKTLALPPFPKETILFANFTARRTLDLKRKGAFVECQYKLSYQSAGWNEYWTKRGSIAPSEGGGSSNTSAGGFMPIYSEGKPYKCHPPKNLELIFPVM